MKTMEVVFVEFEDPRIDSSGGIMSYLKNLSQYLKQNGVKTHLLGVDIGRDSRDFNIENSPFYKFVPVMKTTRGTNVSFIFHLLLKIPFLEIPKSTIIHSQRPDTLFPFLIFNRNNPKICTLHGTHDKAVYHKKGFIFGKIYDVLQYLSFKRTSVLIAVDTGTKDHYTKRFPWLKNKICVISPGVDVRKFRPLEKNKLRKKYGFTQKDKIIIFVGRLEKEKNLGFLIKTFGTVKNEVQNAKLLLVGEGTERNRLNSMVNESGLKDVVFLGVLSHDRIPEVLNCSDVFAFCSLYEGSPTIIKEALLCGLPIVSVDVGDVKEVIEGIHGCYTAERNKKDFANKLILALKNNKRVETGDKINRFGYDETGRITMNIYKSLVTKSS